jgi:hypothetical protein
LEVTGRDSAPAPYECAAETQTLINQLFPEGTGTGDVELILGKKFTINGTSEIIDFWSDPDAYGVAANLDKWFLFLVQIDPASTDGASVSMLTSAARPEPFAGNTTIFSGLLPGTTFLIFQDPAVSFGFNSGQFTNEVTLTESGGEDAIVTVEIWGRK